MEVLESIRLADYEKAVKNVFQKTGNEEWYHAWRLTEDIDRIDVEYYADDEDWIVSFKSGSSEVSYWDLTGIFDDELELLYEELKKMGYFKYFEEDMV